MEVGLSPAKLLARSKPTSGVHYITLHLVTLMIPVVWCNS